jgi:GDP-L-fucose synthase
MAAMRVAQERRRKPPHRSAIALRAEIAGILQAQAVRRYDEAVASGASLVNNWGTGSPRREFLHVDDMAEACLHLLENYDGPSQVNVGTGTDVTIKEIAETIARVVGFTGTTEWDTTKPDGTPQKLLDVSKLRDAGWVAWIGLDDGLRSTVEWYREP